MNSDLDGAAAAGGIAAEERSALEHVSAYVLASEVAARAWDDATAMRKDALLVEVGPQLLRAAGSIAANIAEGYGRRSPRDRLRYYEYALGSALETASWYRTAKPALADIFDERTNRLTSVRRLLLTMIKNERRGSGWNAQSR